MNDSPPLSRVSALLAGDGALLGVGPFTLRLTSRLPELGTAIERFYGQQLLSSTAGFADFHIRLARPPGLRRWYRPQVYFYFDGRSPFKPLPAPHAYPLFEWGLNWCIAQHAHDYLMVHSAVVERGGRALVLPGMPGSGKSTLCAALVNRGWRLLSDEFALIALADGRLTPLPRPVSLKNESIGVIRRFAPEAIIGPESADTTKGTVAHMKAPPGTVERGGETAAPGWVVFPAYQPGAATVLEPVSKGQAMMALIEDSFNYSVLGVDGFTAMADFVDASGCFELSYGDLEDVVARLTALASDGG